MKKKLQNNYIYKFKNNVKVVFTFKRTCALPCHNMDIQTNNI